MIDGRSSNSLRLLSALQRPLGRIAAGRPSILPAVAAHAILFLTAASAQPARTQAAGQDLGSEVHDVRGSVSRFMGDSSAPVPEITVVLHRVGSDSAAALDSAVTDPAGRFRMVVRPFGTDSSAYYFVSARHAGIAYFSEFATHATLDTANFDVLVFDTTTAPVPTTVLARHMFVLSAEPGGTRRIVEMFDVANDSSVTRIAIGDSGAVWSTSIPREARKFAVVGPATLSAETLIMEDGVVRLLAPLAPGIKQLIFEYSLPGAAFPLKVPVEESVDVFEIFLEDTDAAVTGGGFSEVNPVLMATRSVRRLVADDVAAHTIITVTVPEVSGLSLSMYLLLVVLVVGVGMLVALALSFRRRAPAVAAAPAAATDPGARARNDLVRRIAELDSEYESRTNPDQSTTDRYKAERERLKRKLSSMLARR